MSDITMCQADCPVSHECLRHLDSGARPDNLRQSWAAFEPDSPCGCDAYIPKKWEPQSGKGGLSA